MRKVAGLDTICGRVNPVLILVAAAIALLDLSVAAQRLGMTHPITPTPAVSARAAAVKECSPVLPPELREMIGRD